jgi:hypothetical protein
MAFGVYYPLSEVSARLGKSMWTVKRWAEKGELGTVWRLASELMVSEEGLLAFMGRHVADFSDEAKALRREALERKLGRIAPPARGPFSAGVSARSEGELRRKLHAVQTSEHQEETA